MHILKTTALSGCLLAAGCQTSPFDDSAWPERRPLGLELEAYQPPRDPEQLEATTDSVDLPASTDELTLRNTMALALTRSPELRAFGWEVRAAEARILQAGLWSNPELEVEIDEFGGTGGGLSGTDAAEFTVSLAQTFPLGGDIARRRDLAGYNAALAGWDYEAARIEVLTEVTKRYIAVLAAQRSLVVAQQEVELSEAILTIARKRLEAGAAAQVEVIRARVPVAEAMVQMKQAQRRLSASRYQLALSWGQQEPTFGNLVGDLDQLSVPPKPEALAQRINQNPGVARWATEISAHRARVALARAEAVPDLTGRLGVKRFNEIDETALVLSVSLPLPIFDRRQGDILAARLSGSAASERRKQAELRLATQLSSAWTQLANAYEEAVAIRDVALPSAEESFEVTRRAFESGGVGFIDVIDAERTLVGLRARYIAALNTYHTSAAEIEGLIAQPLSDLADAASTPTEPNQE